jgi:hypothetical protein
MIQLKQADFVDRNNFANFLNKTYRFGTAVEIGVHRGTFAKTFMDSWLGSLYIGIDPWQSVPGYEEQEKLLEEYNGNREDDYNYCSRLLWKHIKDCRAELHRGLSEDIVRLVDNNSIDFVYIDGDHRYVSVWNDLTLWYPKVRPGGILAGHDFLQHGDNPPDKEVQQAVINFSIQQKLPIHLVVESQCLPWSFYFEKPK